MRRRRTYETDGKSVALLISALVITALIAVFASGYKAWVPLIVLLVVYAMGFVLLLNRGGRLQWKVRAGGSSEKNSPFTFDVTVKNQGWLPMVFLGFTLEVENLMNGEKLEVTKRTSLRPKGEKTMNLEFKSPFAGQIRLSSKRAYISGILGLVKRPIEADFAMDYTVFPEVTEMNMDRETIAGYDMESFKYSDTKKGTDPGEIFGIREYQPGDSVKTIHWKLSGKLGHIMVREMGFPIENNIMIILDKNPQDSSPENVDRLTDLFFSLSFAIAHQGIKHDIGWYDSVGQSFVVRTVENTDSLWEKGAETLKAPSGAMADSTVKEFIRSDVAKVYSNYLVVGNHPEDIERLMEYGAVTEFDPKSEN